MNQSFFLWNDRGGLEILHHVLWFRLETAGPSMALIRPIYHQHHVDGIVYRYVMVVQTCDSRYRFS